MRVHCTKIVNGEPISSAFCDIGRGMSTNWKKYCVTAEEARLKAREPAKNGIIEFVVKAIRSIPPLSVEHTPDIERKDRSHAEVIGEKDAEVRMKLGRAFQWAIKLVKP